MAEVMEMKSRKKKKKTSQIIDANLDKEEEDSVTIDPHAYEEPPAPSTPRENNSTTGSVATLVTDTEEVRTVPSQKQGEKNFGSMFLRSLAKQNRVIPVDGETDGRPSSAPLQNPLFKPRDQLDMLQRPQTAAAMNTSFSCNIQPKMENAKESVVLSDKKSCVSLPRTEQMKLQSELNEVAYIPYEYAQSMISRMVNDMKNMKAMHLEVIFKIEDQYKYIEKESQRQFSFFVANLQKTYKERINVFRANMGRLNVEMKTNKAQHANTMQSLKSKNKQLLNEKVKALQTQKSEFETAGRPQAQYFKESTKESSVIEGNKPDIDYDIVVPVPVLIPVKTDDKKSEEPILEDKYDDIAAKDEQEREVLKEEEGSIEQATLPDVDKEHDQEFADEDVPELEAELEDEEDEGGVLEEQETEFNEEQEDAEFKSQSEEEEEKEELDIGAGGEDLEVEFSGEVDIKKSSSQIAKGVAVSKTLGEKRALKELDKMKAQIAQQKQKSLKSMKHIKELELKLKNQPSSPQKSEGAVDNKELKKLEKRAKDLEKKLELETKKASRDNTLASTLDVQVKAANKEISGLKQQLASNTSEFTKLTAAAETGAAAIEKVESLSSEVKALNLENQTLVDNYNTERVLRKKYYNMVEDMKGKIRVYCRVRPLSKTEKENKNQYAVQSPDDYTIKILSTKGTKEFQFDSIFTQEHSQATVFEDTNTLIQSAVDGYNVCIFAYGQTGSGKTYTMIGDNEQQNPGIAPRAFERVFDLVEKNKKKFSFLVSCYMLELYNEKLIDLLSPKGSESAKLDIKKDNKGMVVINGATVCEATDSDHLFSIFSKGSQSRHIASTKMNAESSRSHLIIGVVIESTNITSGAVIKGKLSLVDLAGSERVGKTGATDQQLKEANSINKSLSALGDVISALSSDQGFIPYRNNKLTMLMQDSLGGNAKTLMFVNISPADYNTDESTVSLTYASRVKLITNDASKNAESKEVAKLKQIISKLKAGEDVDDSVL